MSKKTKPIDRPLTFRGQTKTLGEWAAETGIAPRRIMARLAKGWSVEQALATQLALFDNAAE